jgi:hypothetical protein
LLTLLALVDFSIALLSLTLRVFFLLCSMLGSMRLHHFTLSVLAVA